MRATVESIRTGGFSRGEEVELINREGRRDGRGYVDLAVTLLEGRRAKGKELGN